MNSRISYLVDSSVYDSPSGHGIDVYRALSDAVRIDLRYHYSGPVCAGHWLDLCQSPEYGHAELVRETDSRFSDVLRVVGKTNAPDVGISVVSLGPGDGEIDTRLLAHIQNTAKLVRYVGVDVSFELLQYAVRRVANSATLIQDFGVTALWADFTTPVELPPKPPGSVNLILLTGFTFGNHRESLLINNIARIVDQEDFLFLDARLHSLPSLPATGLTDEQMRLVLKGYSADPANQFAFGPVEVVTTATAAGVEFGHEVNQRMTSVANAFNVIMYCRNLSTRMRLNGQPVQLPRLDLARGTTYRYEDLADWFPSVGFDVAWKARTDDIGFFLLRRLIEP